MDEHEHAFEEHVAQCKASLGKSLDAVHKWTIGSSNAAGLLLHRMNRVLCAAVDSNFGSECADSIEVLHRSIARLQPEMMNRCEDLPTLCFARSFAVVLDEVVRQKAAQQDPKPAGSPPPPYAPPDDDFCDAQTPREEDLMMVEDERRDKEEEEVDAEERCSSTAPALAATEFTALAVSECPAPVPEIDQPAADATAAAVTTEDCGHRTPPPVHAVASAPPPPTAAPPIVSEATERSLAALVAATSPTARNLLWKKRIQEKYPDKILDFSPEAIEGRIAITQLPASTREEDVLKMLEPFGSLLDFFMPKHSTKVGTHALVKFENNRVANEAAARLNGRLIGSSVIKAQRVEYVAHRPGEKFTLRPVVRPMVQRVQQPEPPSSCEPAAASTEEVGCGRRKTREDWVEAVVEIRDDRSDSSFFSID